jgi:deoxyribodipyrimidine photo-lyase
LLSEVAYEEKETWFKQPFKLRCELETFSSSIVSCRRLAVCYKDIPDVLPILEKNRARCYSKSCFDGPLAITSPDIPEMILPTLQELGLEFSEIDSRADSI